MITLDGLRWQEFFTGADRDYFKKEKNGEPGAFEKRFWRPAAAERRAALMPFVWTTVAAKGQIFGDPSKGSRSHVTNGLWFSYPGYNEMLSGAADPRVDSNDKVPNPNVTVLEWLNSRPGFQGRVAAFGSWDVLPFILNTGRSHLTVGSGFTPVPEPKTDRERAINELAADLPTYWDYGPFDAPIVYAALESLHAQKPRVLYVMLGEGDEWAHEGPLRSLSRRHLPRRPLHPPGLGHAAVDAGVCEPDHAAGDDRSWARRDGDRLDRPREEGTGRGIDLDARAGPRRAAARRARIGHGHDLATGRHHRRGCR